MKRRLTILFLLLACSVLLVGIASTVEGTFASGKWIACRRMNGDQDHQGRHVRIEDGTWGIQKVKLYTYE